MKIGILTFHDEINYGSLLQAYAMQTVLQGLGHDAVIIDRWFQPCQERLWGVFKTTSVMAWVRFLAGLLTCSGEFSLLVRQWRSRRFIRNFLCLTKYHFHEWIDAPANLGLDMITIGSDQVWNKCFSPKDYLPLHGHKIAAIAYSASIGMTEIPADLREVYRLGIGRLKAVGVREKEAVELINRLGFEATHVVDPTLLADCGVWGRFVRKGADIKVAAYFLSEDLPGLLAVMDECKHHTKGRILLYTQGWTLPIPIRKKNFMKWIRLKKAQARSRVECRFAAGPEEFVDSIANADCVVTNSFHALMFALIFRKNVRVVEPTSQLRKKMASRMNEFVGTMIGGPVIQPDLKTALDSIQNGEQVYYDEMALERRRTQSMRFLRNAIKSIEHERGRSGLRTEM